MAASFTPLTDEQLGALAKASTHPGIREYLGEVAADGHADYDGRFVRHEGTLKLSAFDTDDEELTFLHVTGDLIIDGLYRDASDDGPTMIVVDGSLRCKNAIVAGFLAVGGDLVVQEAIYGDYNDGGALVMGDLRTKLFLPLDIGFDVRGQLEATEHIKGLRPQQAPKILDPRFFEVDEGSVTLFSGASDDQALLEDLAAGRSILREGA